MFKLLVIDDEPNIVEALYDVFLENRPEGELDVYKAYNAQEALEILDKIRMDAVVTDIKMPGMDGLQLMAHINRRWPSCRVVILTGHDEFGYIYEANRHPGVRYLLKNESFEKIRETVDACLDEVARGYHDDKLMREAEQKRKNALPLLQRELLSGLLEPVGEGNTSQEILDEYEIPLLMNQPVYLVMGCIVSRDGQEHRISQAGRQTIGFTVERQLTPYASVTGFTCWKDYYLCLVQPLEYQQTEDEQVRYYKRLLEEAQSICKESAGLNVSFVVSAEALPWDLIGNRAAAMRYILNQLVWQGMAVIVTDTEYSEPQDSDLFSKFSSVYRLLGDMSTLIEQGKSAEFFQFFTKLERLADSDAVLAAAIYYSLTVMLSAYSASWNKQPQLETINFDVQDTARPLADCRRLALSIFQTQTAVSEKRYAAVIQKVCDYIQNNLSGDCSLNNLAEMVFFNPKYLSRLFKQETGKNLSDYINDAKMTLAKRLLADKTLKVHEVGNAIGYFSSAYFTKFFRKNMRISPKEYRKSIGII